MKNPTVGMLCTLILHSGNSTKEIYNVTIETVMLPHLARVKLDNGRILLVNLMQLKPL